MKNPLRKIGGFHPMDQEGNLLNPCRVDLIRDPWAEAVWEARDSFLAKYAALIHSLYLRGSIPRGEGIPGVSDIDLIAVLLSPHSHPERDWVRTYRKGFLGKYPFVSGLEINLVAKDNLLNMTGFLSYRFILKHLSLCLFGEDLSHQIPSSKPSLRVAYAFHFNIREEIDKTLEFMAKAPPPRPTLLGCTWIMKRIVRSGFAIFMEEERLYTRDLYPCYEIFAKHHPEKESEMRRALEWAVQPTSSHAEIAAFLKSFGRWLADRAFQAFHEKKG